MDDAGSSVGIRIRIPTVPIASIALLVFGLALLTIGAEVLVRGSVALAGRAGVSSFFIGLTIVGFGTSSPELAASIAAAVRGHSDINVGNVVGSNICNIALILGAVAIIAPVAVRRRVVKAELWILLVASALPFVALLTGGVLGRWLAGVMLLMLGAYLWRGYIIGRAEALPQAAIEPAVASDMEQLVESMPEPAPRAWRSYVFLHVLFILIGLGMLIGGSNLLVQSAVTIAESLGLSNLVIGLTIVAIGTSAPELMTSIVAAIRRQTDLAVGNIFGSNIFNILGILGISSLITPPHLSNQTFMLDVPVMLLLTVACFPIMLSGGRISRGEGTALVIAYLAYLAVLLRFAPSWFG
jgi:cation:H+ antiporter